MPLPHNERERWRLALQDSVSVSEKNRRLTVALSLVCLDRFYVGRPLLGIAKILTGGGCIIWWLVDIGLAASGRMMDGDGKRVVKP
jgi:TM2 domain-containing membrane protein YozV